MFVISACAGSYWRKAFTYSSASTTANGPSPSRAFPSSSGTSPPTSTSGSRSPLATISARMAVVVVLPCVPATASRLRPALSLLTISARVSTGTRRSRAAASSGLSSCAAAVATTSSALPRCAAA